MKRAIDEQTQIVNALFDKIKEHDEAINKMESLKENFKKNRAKIFAVIGNMLAMAFEEFGDYIAIIMPGTALGNLIVSISKITLFGALAITMYVFGNKHELDIKSDIIIEKDMIIHALRTNEAMKDYILAEKNITAPKFEKID